MMSAKSALTIKVSLMLLIFFAVLMSCIFGSAGSFNYIDGWIGFGVFLFWTSILTFYFLVKNPALIERRTQTEKERKQQLIQSLNAMMFLAMIIVPGLDYRYQLSHVPLWLIISSAVIVSLGFLIVFFVFMQNSYLASNIKTFENQKVITDGLYSRMRHPMYSGAYLIILFLPLVMGSYLALLPAVVIAVLIVFRALHEEKVLIQELKGYKEYCKKVKYRFIPLIW